MKDATIYSDKEIATNTQHLFLKTAGFVIKIVLEPAEQVFFKKSTIENIQKTWGRSGFLHKSSSKKPDFEIRFASDAKDMGIIEKNEGKDHYYLSLRRNYSSRKAVAYHFTSLPLLTILLKEILSFLLRKDGFLLHASACKDTKSNLKLFLASSGGGKTTTANLLSKGKSCTKFSDDIVVVRKMKEKWYYYSPCFVEKDSLPMKKEARSAEIYFVKKSQEASVAEIKDKKNVLKEILKQIWVNSRKLEKDVLTTAMSFVADNDFYLLRTTLSARDMQKLLYEN